MTTYIPEGPWKLIMEFHNGKPLRDRAKSIADMCVNNMKNLQHNFHDSINLYVEHSTIWRVRSNILYPDIIPMTILSDQYGYTEIGCLFSRHLEVLLKINGIEDPSEMNKRDMIKAYLKL